MVDQLKHPAVLALLRFFEFSHLPPELSQFSSRFRDLAYEVSNGPQNAETTTALRKLLEAKDCAVRAQLDVS